MAAVSTKKKVLLAAVVLGLLASIMIVRFLNASKAGSAGAMVTTVVTTTRIDAGTVITRDMIAAREVQAQKAPNGACAGLAEVVNRVAMVTLPPDTTVTQALVETPGADIQLIYVIPAGMRAVSVAVDPVIGVAGFPKPGNFVDVVATYRSGDAAIARTVVQDVKLLATGAQVQSDHISKNEGGPSSTGTTKDTVTLLVTPAQAERLTLAESEGKLRLALRGPGDQMHVTTAGAVSFSRQSIHVPPTPSAPRHTIPPYYPRDENLDRTLPAFGSQLDKGQAADPEPAGKPEKPEIQVIRGIEVQTVQVER